MLQDKICVSKGLLFKVLLMHKTKIYVIRQLKPFIDFGAIEITSVRFTGIINIFNDYREIINRHISRN